MQHVRPTAVAGTFYPKDAPTLRRAVEGYLDGAEIRSGTAAPKAVIVPHAGYVYSAAVAALAYARLGPARGLIRRVVLLGPAHRVPVRGLAAPTVDAFATPLGLVPVDRAAIAAVADLPQVVLRDDAHGPEHSLEVQLPFLQELLGRFSLAPFVVGQASDAEVAQVLERLWGGDETLIVVSSDLSHFHDYAAAGRLDRATAHAIEGLEPDAIGFDHACGRMPIAGLLTVARRRNLAVERLDLRNSGDTAGPRDRVVGYGAWAFCGRAATRDAANGAAGKQDDAHLAQRHGQTLLKAAATAIRDGFDGGHPQADADDLGCVPEILRQPRATFVTLKRARQLRGCIGNVDAVRPLLADLRENACAAAFRDPRFEPLRPAETGDLSIAISILGCPTEMAFADEADLLRQLRPGADGLIIAEGGRRAVFLPLVWSQLSDPRDFLGQLKGKAGLAAGYWSPTLRAFRFGATAIGPAPFASCQLPAPTA